jgi:hypothetical protein
MPTPPFARTHADDGIPDKGGELAWSTPIAGGPFYVWVGGDVGTAANLEVVPAGQSTSVVYPDVPTGAFFPMLVTQVVEAGTGHALSKLRWGR